MAVPHTGGADCLPLRLVAGMVGEPHHLRLDFSAFRRRLWLELVLLCDEGACNSLTASMTHSMAMSARCLKGALEQQIEHSQVLRGITTFERNWLYARQRP